MRFTPGNVRHSRASHSTHDAPCGRGWLLAALLAVGSLACGPTDLAHAEADETLETRTEAQGLTILNGIITNGIITNGIITNGIITNGLSNANLGAADFDTWFNEDPDARAELMHYLVQCAVPAGETRTYRHTKTGTRYTWTGNLGLAPDWADGKVSTEEEQQLVSACLGALINKYGVHVPISVQGRTARGVDLVATDAELTLFSEREGCFFGNLFTGQGLYAAIDRGTISSNLSSPRACVLGESSGSTKCAPILHVGSCSNYCTRDSQRRSFVSCTYNGVTYRPLATRLRAEDFYRCGDGVCQFTERCGTSSETTSCFRDCGACSD